MRWGARQRFFKIQPAIKNMYQDFLLFFAIFASSREKCLSLQPLQSLRLASLAC